MVIYNSIGTGYNLTRRADPYIFSRLRELLDPGYKLAYLDVGCGTGNYTSMFSRHGYGFTGVEPSEIMLAEARKQRGGVSWLKGSAENIPVADNAFHGAIATFTTHHWSNMQQSFLELRRVLVAGSRVVILTFTPAQEQGYWLNEYFPQMMLNSIMRKNTYEVVMQAAADVGFIIRQAENYFVHQGLEDLFCYAGKHDPEIYFDPAVRAGISSFALWPQETANGLQKLRSDIDSGQFMQVKKQYENNEGDYVFVVLESP